MNLSLRPKRPSANAPLISGELARLREEMDRVFDRVLPESLAIGWRGLSEPGILRSDGWLPAMDVSDTDTELVIRAEVPGMPAKDLDISVSGHTLTLSGRKEESCERKEESYFHCERRFGSFRRSIELPEYVEPDKVTAESSNGVVTIHVAKKPGSKPRQIEIKPTATKVLVSQ